MLAVCRACSQQFTVPETLAPSLAGMLCPACHQIGTLVSNEQLGAGSPPFAARTPAEPPPASTSSSPPPPRPRSRILWWPPVLAGVLVFAVGGSWLLLPRETDQPDSFATRQAQGSKPAPAVPAHEVAEPKPATAPPVMAAAALPDPAEPRETKPAAANRVADQPAQPAIRPPAASRPKSATVASTTPGTPQDSPEQPTLVAWADVALAVIDPGRFAVGLRRGKTGDWLVQARATDQLADEAARLLVRRGIPRIAADPLLARQLYLDSADRDTLSDAQRKTLDSHLQHRKFLPPLFRDEPRWVVYRDAEGRRQRTGLLTAIDAESLSLATPAGSVERVLASQVAPGTIRLSGPAEVATSLIDATFWEFVALNVALALQSPDHPATFQQVAVLSQVELRPGQRTAGGDRTNRARQRAWKLLTRQLGDGAGLSPGIGLTVDLDRAVTQRLQALSIPVCDEEQFARLVPDRPERFLANELAGRLHATHVLSISIDAEAAVPSVAVELLDLLSGRELWRANSRDLATDPQELRQYHPVSGRLALIEPAEAAFDVAQFWEPEHVLAPPNWQRRRDQLVRIEAGLNGASLRIHPLFALGARDIPADSLKRQREPTNLDSVPADLQLRYVLDHLLALTLPPAAPLRIVPGGNPVAELGSRHGVRPGDRLRILQASSAGEEWLPGELQVSEVRETECVVELPRTGLEAWWPALPALVPETYAVLRPSRPAALGLVSLFYVNPDEKFPVVRKISQLKDRMLQKECFAQADKQTMEDAALLAGKLARACEQLRVPCLTVEEQQVIGVRPNVDMRAQALYQECVDLGTTHVLGGYLWPYDAAVSARGVQMLKYRCKLAIKLSPDVAGTPAEATELDLDLNRSHLGESAP